jgi:hypothetical protein
MFRFKSDTDLAHDSRTIVEWQSFMNAADGQHHWNEVSLIGSKTDVVLKFLQDYAQAYTRLSMLGVNNMNNLTECTKVMPMPKTTFAGVTKEGVSE